MDNIDLDILKFMSERENYDTHKSTITKNLCTKESWRLVEDFGKYFDEFPNVTEIDKDFNLWFRVTGHPGWKAEEHELYSKIISNVQESKAPVRDVFLAQLERTRQTEIIASLYENYVTGVSLLMSSTQMWRDSLKPGELLFGNRLCNLSLSELSLRIVDRTPDTTGDSKTSIRASVQLERETSLS